MQKQQGFVHPDLGRRTRYRRTRSCQPCREKKTKCDTNSPCNACVKRSTPHECTYQPNVTTNFQDEPGFKNCIDQLGQYSKSDGEFLTLAEEVLVAPRYSADFEYDLQVTNALTTNMGEVVGVMLPRFFQLGDSITNILHQGNLFNEWRSFINDPNALSQSESFSFLALIYGCLALTAFYCGLFHEPLPIDLGPLHHMIEVFMGNCHQCLNHGDLEIPGKYKVEASIIRITLLVYYKSDLKRAFGALAQAVGLAELSSYANPRDLQLTGVQAEYPRRAWELLLSLKYYISFYGNKLQMVRPEPRPEALCNLLDGDILEFSGGVPPPCPLTEFTPVLPLILKREIQRVSTEIGLALFCRRDITVKERDQFDQDLNAVYKECPANITGDPSKVHQLKHTLAIIYHAAKIVLHRWSLLDGNISKTEPSAMESRSQCVSSAVEILIIQKGILDSSRSQQNRYQLDPMVMYDFLFATTILCLELSYLTRCGRLMSPSETRPAVISQIELEQWLRSSLEFWEEVGEYWVPMEAQRLRGIFASVLKESIGSSVDEFESYQYILFEDSFPSDSSETPILQEDNSLWNDFCWQIEQDQIGLLPHCIYGRETIPS